MIKYINKRGRFLSMDKNREFLEFEAGFPNFRMGYSMF